METVEETTATSTQTPPPVPLDYGRAGKVESVARRVHAGFWERVHGVAHFFGTLLGIAGGPRQAAFAFGMAAVLGGLGACLDFHRYSPGPAWMAVGGALIGLAYPLPTRRHKH